MLHDFGMWMIHACMAMFGSPSTISLSVCLSLNLSWIWGRCRWCTAMIPLVPLWYHLVWWMLSPVLPPSPCPDHPYCSPRSFWFSQTTLLWGKSLCCCGCKFSRAYDRFATVPKTLLKTLKFWKSLNSIYDPGSRPQKSPKIAQKKDHSFNCGLLSAKGDTLSYNDQSCFLSRR